MKCHALLVRTSVLLSLAFLVVETPRFAAQSNPQAASPSSIVQTPAVAARITQAIDETQLVRLKGNVHPLARPEFDQGDRKSTRLNSSHGYTSYAVFCL